ncbi:MAG: Hydrogenase maturation factor HypB [Anaerolineales bacterium]|mgnify:FL=1|jgi:hydrogenase nickel incorporation protein HypB|nr:Hydrogenase maturation factor HypB [Anaerolineales bacterium]MDX9935851.1 hydrogenase nickel incorporation protein HypB [Anaerolineales bacterium]WKZ50195.1 MAG: hydrogenase nickel incorporation protein HypB [Anaerolineales bacterium]GER79772.1 hydrogenase accessory protein HypB [Candidatus Denitrolinea symbiosum]HPP63176.1 hydrogenase nickel incorporation protein HypB [Anaerolineales bacterium]
MTQRIPVVENILNANDKLANENRARLDAAGVFAINLMASPGAGKTSLIEQTLPRLAGRARVAVVDGDIATSLDAERAAAAGALASIQINTGGDCHLDAVMLRGALDQLDLSQFDLLIVENVGNLVCPASFKLGAHKSVLVASIPEGDDKPYKYPGMYRGVDALVVNKIDLLPYINFRMDYFQRGVEALNPGVVAFPLSCRTGEGLDGWVEWLMENSRKK